MPLNCKRFSIIKSWADRVFYQAMLYDLVRLYNESRHYLDYTINLDTIYMIMLTTKHTVFSVTTRNLPCIEAPAPPPMTIPLRIETFKCLQTNVTKW